MSNLIEAKKKVMEAKDSLMYWSMTNVFDKTVDQLVVIDLGYDKAKKEYYKAESEYLRLLGTA